MKQYIRCSKKPYTVSRRKLYNAVFIKDIVKLEPIQYSASEIASVGELRKPLYDGTDYNDRVCYKTWADLNNIEYSDLKKFVGEYIIDTQGHLDSAALSDNEDAMRAEHSLAEAIQEAVKQIMEDFKAYSNDPSIVEAEVILKIYGYGNHHVTLSNWKCLLYRWGQEKANLGYDMRGVYEDDPNSYLGISFRSALENRTDFRRNQIRAILKVLADPIDRLK